MANSIFDLLYGMGEGTASDEQGYEFLRRLIGNTPVGEAPSGEQLSREAGSAASETAESLAPLAAVLGGAGAARVAPAAVRGARAMAPEVASALSRLSKDPRIVNQDPNWGLLGDVLSPALLTSALAGAGGMGYLGLTGATELAGMDYPHEYLMRYLTSGEKAKQQKSRQRINELQRMIDKEKKAK